ncbi:surface polysaccharide O-acyltransferase-like enzyme [Clostridium pascui]|uniref:acyltransferase n=1 Tax=Clostridium pascui TaxID=46609 RepID=UPI00195658E7|nr:acyltransferase [Clostridium pascui]MBM7869813.1 surface polysaccharide O-acyltransferase-like enzyme [Clostridium pascui]
MKLHEGNVHINKDPDNTKGNKKRILEMDVCRALATIAVIVIHTSAYTLSGVKDKGSELYYITLIINQLARFSVPAFVFISGVGLALSYKKNTNYFKFEFKRLLSIVPEYLIWCFIYLYIISNNKNFHTWPSLILSGDKAYYHFYFVPMIVKLYILFPILYIVMKKKIGLLVSFLITAGILTTGHYYNIPNLTLDFYSKRNILFWIFYFSLGIYISGRLYTYIGKLKGYKKFTTLLFIICTVLIMMESIQGVLEGKLIDYYTTFLRPSIIVYSLSAIALIFSLNLRNNLPFKFLKAISDKSYVMYLAHPSILYYYMKWMKEQDISLGSSFFLISSTIICICITLLIGKIVERIKLSITRSDY